MTIRIRLARRWADETLTSANLKLIADMERYDTENMEIAIELCDARSELDEQDKQITELRAEVAQLRGQLNRALPPQMAVYPPAGAVGTLAYDRAWHSRELALDAVSNDVDEA